MATTTVGQYLDQATKQLKSAGITTARLDCLVLLEDVLQRDRATLLAHPELPLNHAQKALLNKFITRRLQHEPLAYIRGHAPFYGREFAVDERVLVPRPESESMIDLLKMLHFFVQPRFADIGTGSGCLGITAALEVPQADVYLYDIDPDALRIARTNALMLEVPDVHVSEGDLLSRLPLYFDVLLANLPYVPDGYPINQAACHEPKLALFAGADGMDLYRRFWQQVGAKLHEDQSRYIITESLLGQHRANQKLAHEAGYQLGQTLGLAQLFVRSGV